jgi:hypothetical protein
MKTLISFVYLILLAFAGFTLLELARISPSIEGSSGYATIFVMCLIAASLVVHNLLNRDKGDN